MNQSMFSCENVKCVCMFAFVCVMLLRGMSRGGLVMVFNLNFRINLCSILIFFSMLIYEIIMKKNPLI